MPTHNPVQFVTKTKDDQWRDLMSVVTVPEICQLWGKTRKAVMMRIYKGDFSSRQSGITHLVHIASVIHWWGTPEGLLDD